MDASATLDTEILRHVLEGDVRAAGTRLVLGFADEVYALCRSMVRDGTLAEDLSQDVFSRAFSALPKFRGEASVRTWILRIARNRCIDHLRAQNREPPTEQEPDAHPTSEPSVSDLLMRRQDVQAGLDALDESERALVVLRFGHGLGYPELADAFGVREGTARMRVSRAVGKMREAIAAPGMERAVEGPRAAPAPAPAMPSRGYAGDQPPGAPPPPAAAPPPMRAPLPAAPRRRRAEVPAAASLFARPAPSTLRSRLMDLAGLL